MYDLLIKDLNDNKMLILTDISNNIQKDDIINIINYGIENGLYNDPNKTFDNLDLISNNIELIKDFHVYGTQIEYDNLFNRFNNLIENVNLFDILNINAILSYQKLNANMNL